MKKQSIAPVLVAAVVACCAGAVQAQVAGQVLVKAGWNKIMPKVESGDLSGPTIPGSKIDIKSASALLLTATYMVTDSISVEFLGGLPYKHDIIAAGAVAGVGRIGTIHQVSPTLVLQYRFMQPIDAFRPYVGGGATFAKFYKSESSASLTAATNPGGPATLIGGDTSWGGTIQAGLNYRFDKHWFLDAAVLKTWIDTSSHLSSGQDIAVKLNPVSMNVSVGYAF